MACSKSFKIEKGYAYGRNILSGVKPAVTLSEDGSVTEKQNSLRMQYFIYIRTNSTRIPGVTEIWIDGKSYAASAEKVSKFPVTVNKGHTQEDTLFAAPEEHLWKINVGDVHPMPEATLNNSTKFPVGEVRIGFMRKGKLHYYPIADLKFLEPVTLE
ncbi:MAG: hypothetical protein ABIO77_07520 [Ginsengibacter sp.]